MQAAGAGSNAWRLDLHLQGRRPTAFKIVGMRQAPSTHMRRLLADVPDWVDVAIQLAVATNVYTL